MGRRRQRKRTDTGSSCRVDREALRVPVSLYVGAVACAPTKIQVFHDLAPTRKGHTRSCESSVAPSACARALAWAVVDLSLFLSLAHTVSHTSQHLDITHHRPTGVSTGSQLVCHCSHGHAHPRGTHSRRATRTIKAEAFFTTVYGPHIYGGGIQ